MPITLSQYRALAEVRYRIRSFLVFSETRARTVGLEPQQHQLLLAVRGLPAGDEPTVGRVAERLQVQHNSAVELVNRSIEKGIVRKRGSQRDRRQVLVDITPKGRRLLEKLAALHRAELLSMGPALTGALAALVPGTVEATP